jgi:hypothetical protein
MRRSFLTASFLFLLLISCSSPTENGDELSNGDNNNNNDGEGPQPTAANVVGQETGVSYSQGSESASMNYRLSNTGETEAYNVQYRLKISYKCLTGMATQGWTNEFLPSSSTLYNYGDIPAGQYVDFTDSQQLCDGLGIEQFTFEVYQVSWN